MKNNMKQIIVLVMILASTASILAQTTLETGDNCFDIGDYVCAKTKYQEVMNTATGRDKQIAEIKYSRAKSCNDWLTEANRAFDNEDYQVAKENYQFVLNENRKDPYAQSQLEKCDTAIREAIRLSISKENTTFSPLDGNETIDVITNAESYSISQSPSWCTVQKYSDYFVISYTANTGITSRNGSFKITAGGKEVDLYVTQPEKPKTTLSVVKDNLSFTANNSTESIFLKTNSSDYEITNLPSWCRVNYKYADWFILEYDVNYSSSSRSGWFNITAGDQKVRINVNQAGATQNKATPATVQKENKKPNKRSLGSFSSLGIQSGEIAFLGLLYESGGRRTVGFHISARTSLITDKNIWNEAETIQKTEIQLGPNFKILKRLYLNIGGGYGYSDKVENIDNFESIEESGYFVGTSGLMIRLSRVININGGVSFMGIDENFNNPEITFGISFNLKGKNKY